MGLALSVVKGSKVYIGDEPISILSLNGTQAKVSYKGTDHDITVAVGAFVEPNVKVSLGINHQSIVRLVIDAPPHIRILREKLYGHHQTRQA